MDVAVEAVLAAQNRQRADHQLRRIVRRAQHAGGEEQPFDIIAAVEFDRQLGKLFGRKGRARRVVRAAVDAVFAVVAAVVREQHLQERHAAAVGRKRVAAARDGRGRAADLTLPIAALGPARGAGGVVLCRVGKDRELVEKVHVLSGRISLCGAWAGRAGAACSSPWW